MNFFFPKLKKTSNGFTIVETLVAIAILMIAVAGPLVAASRSLNAALYSRDQMIGSFLAQETMEVIKSRRNNVVNVDPANWPDVYAACTDVAPCEVSASDPALINQSNCPPSGCTPTINTCPATGCLLRLGFDGYSTRGTEAGLTFYRSFYLKPVTRAPGPSPFIQSYEVHVIVGWNQGKIPYELELVSELVSAPI